MKVCKIPDCKRIAGVNAKGNVAPPLRTCFPHETAIGLTSTRHRVHGCADASMAARTLLRICTTSVSGQSWQIWRRIHAVLGFWEEGSVSAASTHALHINHCAVLQTQLWPTETAAGFMLTKQGSPLEAQLHGDKYTPIALGAH